MYFKRIEMQGFKSFADPVIIEFHEGITCIVGPNGSGKSNISDAIRWVLGEQSPKLLRGGKMEEVIFAGTTNRKSRGMAEVTLVIDNSTGILPIEYNEVAITRRMYRSGESEYLINNNQCRLKDIRELIMDTGIGVDGYSIIGQGKIADIVSTKAEDRREIFEEAAGVVMYKKRKSQAEKKLGSAQDNLDRVSDIVNEIEDRIGSLREDSTKAKEFLNLRDRYKFLEINLALNNIGNLDKNTEALKGIVSESEEKIKSLVNKRDSLEAEMDQLMEKNENLDELSAEANDNLIRKVNELNIINSQGQVNEERLSAVDKDIARLKGEIKETDEKLNSENAKLKELEKNEEVLQADKISAEKKLHDAVIRLNSVTLENNELVTSIDDKKNRIIDINNENVGRNGEINTLRSYKQSLTSRKSQIKFENNSGDERGAGYKVKTETVESQLGKHKETLKICENEIVKNEQEILSLNEEYNLLSKQIDDNNIKLNRTYARKKTIEEMENNYEGYNSAVKFTMKSGVKDVYGTVSDIIKVPKGLELAIETALGAGMQNIVCEDDSTAKNMISTLKKNSAGRATFLPVRSIYGKKLSVEKMEGLLGVAADMVEFDGKFNDVVNYLLGRVIITKTMDDAVRLSKKLKNGARFVTVEGEVVNASGAITGGKYRNKSANLIERKAEIANLATEFDKLSEEKNILAIKKETNDKKKTDNSKEKEKLAAAKQGLLLEIGNLNSELTHIKDLIRETGINYDKYDKELKRIAQDIQNAEQMIDKHKNEMSEAETELEKLNEEVDKLLVAADELTDKIEASKDEITNCKVTVNESETKVFGLNELIERIHDTLIDYEDELSDATSELEDLLAEKELLCTGDDETGEKESELKKEKENLEKYIEQAAKEKTSINSRYAAINEEQKAIAVEQNNTVDQKYRDEIKLARNDTQLTNIKDKLWDEFEISYAEAKDMKEDDFPITSANKECREVKIRLKELGDVNISSIDEYEKVGKRYEFLTEQRKDILGAMDELKEIIFNMDKTIKKKFKDHFDKVVINFETIFKELFNGGHAELRLEDDDNPLESGVVIVAQPPGKKLKNINLMSGGEKTMTAIALMFAVLKSKPTPFCILDEVEAALDDSNIERFSLYLKKFKEIQFALVTHQRATMQHADVLYGVTMPEHGISKVLSLKINDKFDLE